MIVGFKTQCPYCGTENDTQTSVTNEMLIPEDGDLAICFDCGKVAVIDHSRVEGVRVTTPQENFEIRNSEFMNKVHAAWATATAKKRR
jgi:uncharacterized Zn finger protein